MSGSSAGTGGRAEAQAEADKDVVLRFNDAVLDYMRGGSTAGLDGVLAEDFVQALPGMPADREGLKQALAGFRSALSGFELRTDEVIAGGGRVADRLTWEATHTGELLGIPATGRRLRVTEVHIARVEAGRIMERWGAWDALGLMQQIGAVPGHAAGEAPGSPAVGEDSIQVAMAYDEAWNAHDEKRILDLLTDDAAVRLTPAPPPPLRESYEGKEAVREFVRMLLPGFRVRSRDHRVVGDRVRWRFTISADGLRSLGMDEATGEAEAKVRGGRICGFYPTFDEATVRALQSAAAAPRGA